MFSRLALLAHALAVCSALQLQPSRTALHTPCARPRTTGVFAGRKGRPSGQQGGMQGTGQGGPKGPPEDGSSLFYLYCRAERKDLWYPVSVLQSDSQAQGLISAWLNAPLAKGVFKDRLDEGMARSIFESERQLADMAVRTHPNLAKFKTRLGWGYKIINKDIAAKEASGEMEKQKTVPVFKDMVKPGVLDGVKKSLGI